MADKKISIFVEAVIAGAKRKLAEVERSLSSLGKTTKTTSVSMTQDMGRLEQAGTVLEGAFRQFSILIVGYLTKMAVQGTIQLARLAAKNIDLADSYETLSARYGLASDDLLAALDRAAKGTVDKYSMMLAANKALRLGVATTIEEFEQLMKIAVVRAKEFGMTTTQAFDFIVTAIGRASPMIADNIGILLDANATYKEYAASIGKAAEDLTMLEKKEAIRNRILREGIPDMEAWNEMGVTAATVFQQYDTVMTELRQEMGERFLPVVITLTQALLDLQTASKGYEQDTKDVVAAVLAEGGTIAEAVEALEKHNRATQRGRAGLIDWRDAIDGVSIAEKNLAIVQGVVAEGWGRFYQESMLARKGAEIVADSTVDLTEHFDALRKKAEDSAKAQANYYDSVARQSRSFTRRMEDMSFRYAQAEENAARRRYEILRASQRGIESAQTTFQLRQRDRLEDHQATVRRMRRDYLDDLADMEWDYQQEVHELQKRAPWWIRQALQKEFAERERIAATGDAKALEQYDKALRERIRQIDPVYAKELDELAEHYEHQQEIERRESGQAFRDRDEDYRRARRQQERQLDQRLRELRRALDDQLDSWRFQQQQRHENEARSMERLRQDNAYQLSLLRNTLNDKLTEINRTYEHWGWTHGITYVTKLNEALSRAGPQYTPIPPGYEFPSEWTGFQRGAWEVPYTMPATVHRGEMIIPAGPAEQLREGGGGLTVNIENLNIGAGMSAMSAKLLAQEVGEELGRGIRHGHR